MLPARVLAESQRAQADGRGRCGSRFTSKSTRETPVRMSVGYRHAVLRDGPGRRLTAETEFDQGCSVR